MARPSIRNPYGIPEPRYRPVNMPHQHQTRVIVLDPHILRLAHHIAAGAAAAGHQMQSHVHFRPGVKLDPSQVIDRRQQINDAYAHQIAVQNTPWFHQELYHPGDMHDRRLAMINMYARGIQNTRRHK